jgi:hypothetical protein
MSNIEISQQKLVLKLDKGAGKATLQQRLLGLWNKKPIEFAIAEIDDIR